METAFWIVVAIVIVWWFHHRAEKARKRAEEQHARKTALLRDATIIFDQERPDSFGKNRSNLASREGDRATVAPAGVPQLDMHASSSSRTTMQRRVADNRAQPRWVPQGDPISLGGVTIPDGMIYVGKDSNRYNSRRELIDPNLPVSPCPSLSRAPSLSYWPTYAYLDPEARGAYLRWLAEGRRAPDIDIGYVFLFFYGLERRLFLDKAVDEAPALIAEVERLRELYADNHSFRRYSQLFLEMARLMAGDTLGASPPALSPDWTGEVPLAVRLVIGKKLADGKSLAGDWMLAWYLGHEETRLRTPAQRCFDEFKTLFQLRFAEAYPEGMKVKPPQGKLKLEYLPASGDYQVSISLDGMNVPDISRLKAPVRKAAEIAESCMTDLDSYSRLLGREPEAVGSLKALALLPEDLRGLVDSREVDELKHWLEDLTANRPAVISIDNLLARLDLAQPPLDKVGKPLARSLAQSLRLLGYGIDPDVDIGGSAPRPSEPVVIYRLPPEPPPEGAFSDAYGSAAAVVALTALVIHADDQVTRDEEDHLLRLVEDNLHLCQAERAHLQAHALRLLEAPPSLAQMRTRLKQASKTEREYLARFALAVAAADGHVAPAEIKLLENIYKHLDLDRDQLYGDVHALGGQRPDEPVVVRPADAGPADHAIPPPPAEKPEAQGGVTLDMRHVEKVRGDTHEVSALLSDIFSADEPEPEPEPEPEVTSAAEEERTGHAGFDGLDRRHASLLTCLLDRDDWPRDDFERLCRDFDLLPDGAMEALNEWAFDAFDDPILEDEDPITLNRHLLSPQDATP